MRGSLLLRSLFSSFHSGLGRLFRAQNEELIIFYSESKWSSEIKSPPQLIVIIQLFLENNIGHAFCRNSFFSFNVLEFPLYISYKTNQHLADPSMKRMRPLKLIPFIFLKKIAEAHASKRIYMHACGAKWIF